MGRCHHKLLSAPAVLLGASELGPRLGSARLFSEGGFRRASALVLLPSPTIRSTVAVLAPMADAEDGELPLMDFWSWALGDPREDIDL
jgi:hypothetical protein